MSNSRLPTVRLDPLSEEDQDFHAASMDFQSSSGSKFAFAWPDGLTQDDQKLERPDYPSRPGSYFGPSQVEASASPPSAPSQGSNSHLESSSHPRLSRAFSVPLPSQTSHWQHPGRSPNNSGTPAATPDGDYPTTPDQHFQELALELADSVQMAVQTLLQLSPPHLFDPAKEQFSACAVQIPTPSITALLTSMRNLNYISANMRTFGPPSPQSSMSSGKEESIAKDEFDIGEVLQSVGDSFGGSAADADVDLVLHHGDAIKHMGVKGDECGISYALSHVIHQVLMTSKPGDSIEVGLAITSQPLSGGGSDNSTSSSGSSSSDSPHLDADGPLVCTFDIAHKFSSANAALSDSHGELQAMELGAEAQSCPTETRSEPQFETTILRRLLKHIGGTLRTSLQPRLFARGRRCELAVTLERGPSLSSIHQRTPPLEDDVYRQPFSDVRLGREPSIDELTTFAETLRGKKVAFHASSQGSFAHHLTRYLTAWGMDISHVPTDGIEDKDPAGQTFSAHLRSGYGGVAPFPGVGAAPSGENVPPIVDNVSDTPSETKSIVDEAGLSLIVIDDDVFALRRRLLQYRAEVIPTLHLHSRKRPPLAAHHRPRSSPSIRHALLTAGAQTSSSMSLSPVPIVHFTSLAKYKLIKDVMQNVLLFPGSLQFLPEIIVIPKPAGPRRILNALYTAVHKPLVDPFFMPIATSPMSPSGSMSPFITGQKSTSGTTPPSSTRSGNERRARSGTDSTPILPSSSPLPMPEGLEYFSDAAVKKLGGNAASGLVIQSPDGRPAGIFFQPQSRSSSSRTDLAMTTMERDRSAPRPASQRSSRRSTSRKAGLAEAFDETTPRNGSPSTKSSHLDSAQGLTLPPTISTPREQQRIGDQTDLVRTYKGKGRVGTITTELGETRLLSSAAWKEATQNLANLTPVTPLEPDPDSAVSKSTTQSPTTQTVVLAPLVSSPGVTAPASRSPTSSMSPTDQRKTVARRATLGPKSPVVSTTKKSKPFGNNIVPPISVLIVEDNAINQTILSTFMRRNKIKYEVAWNGREAVEKWRNGNFHLILMDIQMPVMDGIEATKEIRRLEKTENIGHFPPSPGESSRRSVESPDSRLSSAASTPFRSQVIIVALTASSLQSDRVAALAAGCNDFLTKPVTNSWLNDKIIEWGSIKALQMWAELRPEVARNISHDQAAQAQAVANKLHVPPGSARATPLGSPLRERWPMSSDEEPTQDPVTEPPAVINTPVNSTIELPAAETEPIQISGEDALLHFLEESKENEQQLRPKLLGHRAISSIMSSTSIASVLHDTPGVGGTIIDGSATISSENTPNEPPPSEGNSSGH
ncbi:hypothetical protein K439DRAFT_1509640 [Ramaria rubella]|nr:hypothetical protein K439DRAFT_1509640 [Ramaria rubella]